MRDGEFHVPVAVTFTDGKVESIDLSGESSPWMYSSDPKAESAWMETDDDGEWITPTFEEHLRTDAIVSATLKAGLHPDSVVEFDSVRQRESAALDSIAVALSEEDWSPDTIEMVGIVVATVRPSVDGDLYRWVGATDEECGL